MSWSDAAWFTIDELHKTLPADISYADRKKALRDAYPFGLRKHFPYKAWCKAQSAYLARYSDKPAGPLLGDDA